VEDENPLGPKKVLERGDREERISEVESYDREKPKPFSGFFEKVILLVIGFALTTAVGGFLSDRFRRENARTEFEIAAMQSDIGRSVQVFENISQLMDKRLFRMRRLHDVFNGNIGADEYPQRFSDYRNVLIEWNDNVNRYRALYVVSFNPVARPQPLPVIVTDACSESFEVIARGFRAAHNELQKLIDKKEDASTEKTQGLLDDLHVCIYFFDEKMLSNIRDQKAAFKDKITNH
jgi:hypothetical protein